MEGAMFKLNLDGWEVVSRKTSAKYIELNVKFLNSPDSCTKCGSREFNKHGPKSITYIDAPHNGKKVILNAVVNRYKCKECLKTFIQPVSGIYGGSRMTERCIEYVHLNYMDDTYLALANKIGVDDKTIRNIVNAYTGQLIERKT